MHHGIVVKNLVMSLICETPWSLFGDYTSVNWFRWHSGKDPLPIAWCWRCGGFDHLGLRKNPWRRNGNPPRSILAVRLWMAWAGCFEFAGSQKLEYSLFTTAARTPKDYYVRGTTQCFVITKGKRIWKNLYMCMYKARFPGALVVKDHPAVQEIRHGIDPLESERSWRRRSQLSTITVDTCSSWNQQCCRYNYSSNKKKKG